MNKRKLVTDRRPGWIGPYGAADMNVEQSKSSEQQLIDANRRIEHLTLGPGGIMEMKQTICNKEDEILQLQKYKDLAILIANDYYELSYEKALLQRDDWRKRAQQLVNELEN